MWLCRIVPIRGVRSVRNLIAFNVQVVIIKGPLIVGEIVHIISGKGRRGKPELLKCQCACMRDCTTFRSTVCARRFPRSSSEELVTKFMARAGTKEIKTGRNIHKKMKESIMRGG